MKVRSLAAIALAFILCAVTAAQGYSIRIDFNTNLRAGASLQAGVVETAPAGTTLNVVGELGRWLRINRNGNEVWMASWVRHSRVEDSSQASSGTAAQIDNCCFVDRQCVTDQEWTDGYWAFQNGQCAAPSPSQAGTSAQPAGNVAGPIDNCCHAGWHCQTDQEWANGYWAYRDNQCGTAATPVETANSCCQLGWNCTLPSDRIMGEWFIRYGVPCGAPMQVVVDGVIIEGSDYFIRRVSEALALLRTRAPEWHAYVIKGPLKIRAWKLGTHSLERSFNMAPGHVAESVVRRARVLVHESCHVQRWLAGLLRYDIDIQQRTEENLCELAVDYMLDSVQPVRPFNAILEAEVNRLISEGVTNIHELANAERDRAFHLLATMN